MPILVQSIRSATEVLETETGPVELTANDVTVESLVEHFQARGINVLIEAVDSNENPGVKVYTISRTEVVNPDGSIAGELNYETMSDAEKAALARNFAEQYGVGVSISTTLMMEQMNPKREWQKGVENAIQRMPAEKRTAARKLVKEILVKAKLKTGTL